MKPYCIDLARTAKPKTQDRHGYGLRLFLRFLGGKPMKITDLSRATLVDFHAWLSAPETARHGDADKPETARGVTTVSRNVEVVQQFWAWLFNDSQWSDVTPAPRKIKLKRAPSSPTIAPTWAEMDAVIGCAQGWRKRAATMMRFTGLRIFQVMLAKRVDVDVDRGLFVVRHGKTASEAEGRIIPLSRHLVAEIKTWPKGEWLIETGLTTARERQSRAAEMANWWRKAKVRASAWEGSPQHAFRDGFISGMKKLGADDEAVKYLVGHDLGVRGRYVDPEALPMREAVALIPSMTPDAVVVPMAVKESA